MDGPGPMCGGPPPRGGPARPGGAGHHEARKGWGARPGRCAGAWTAGPGGARPPGRVRPPAGSCGDCEGFRAPGVPAGAAQVIPGSVPDRDARKGGQAHRAVAGRARASPAPGGAGEAAGGLSGR
ncbi:hypothetical protein GCM10010515_15890 [Streptomyces fructofermentans]|uniref:Uncharacterized protein n=1 Tax=Streptomyces fructofermentans TaxID=152141 RepID=A0A918K4X5_9ACTN|nr:hypothetical protein GCM10010515_15890 [Streptomyces fructofermentans]